MRVYLDDVRPTPEGWVHAYTAEEAIELLRSGEVEVISLDFDLGFRGEEEHRTGELVVKWIEEQVFVGEDDFVVPEIKIHSANPVGRRRLERAIDTINRRVAGRNE